MADNTQLINFLARNGDEFIDKYNLSKAENTSFEVPDTDFDNIAQKLVATELSAIRRLDEEKRQKLSELDTYTRMLRETKRRVIELDTQLSAVGNPQIQVDSKKQELENLFKKFAIRHINYVPSKVIVFTTDFLRFQGYLLGYFKIWLDFNISDHEEGIRIVNFYKRYGYNDHPCISSGNLCMGDSWDMFSQVWRSKDITRILEACFAFLLSEDVSSGYVNNWTEWARGARRVPPTFNFETIHIRPYRTDDSGQDEFIRSLFASRRNEILDQFRLQYTTQNSNNDQIPW